VIRAGVFGAIEGECRTASIQAPTPAPTPAPITPKVSGTLKPAHSEQSRTADPPTAPASAPAAAPSSTPFHRESRRGGTAALWSRGAGGPDAVRGAMLTANGLPPLTAPGSSSAAAASAADTAWADWSANGASIPAAATVGSNRIAEVTHTARMTLTIGTLLLR
jgi:hypothetical protein